MTLINYIRDILPKKFNKHPSWGKVAEKILLMEKNKKLKDTPFSNNKFENLRDRAEFGIPYQIDDLKERDRVLNVLELILCIHRQEKHGEDYSNRINYLKQNTKFTDEELKMISSTRGFWGG
jgi:hypothetical protein